MMAQGNVLPFKRLPKYAQEFLRETSKKKAVK